MTEDALVKRINRVLAKDMKVLRKTRGSRLIQGLGDYHLFDQSRNWISDHHIDPETLGREL